MSELKEAERDEIKIELLIPNVEIVEEAVNEQNFDVNRVSRCFCGDCKSCTNEEDTLYRHQIAHLVKADRAANLECAYCGLKLKNKCSLRAHIRLRHFDERNHQCDVCHKQFTKEEALRKHQPIHTVGEPFYCDLCPYKSHREELLGRHKKRQHGPERFFCKLCHYSTTYAVDLSRHMKRIHSSLDQTCNHQCYVCNERFGDQRALRRHLPIHTEDETFSCDIESQWENSLVTQEQRQLGHERNLECDVCYRRFSSEEALRKHQPIHTGDKPFSCDLCDFKTHRQGSLYTHKKYQHGHRINRLACPLCNYTTDHRTTFTRHMSVHTGIAIFECAYCGFKLKDKSSLKYHIRVIHFKDKNHQCDVCNKRFAGEGALRRHMPMHTGDKPFSCDLCDFKTHRDASLRLHKRRQHQPKKFSCELCQFSTAYEGDLSRHMKRLHCPLDERPYACPECSYRTTEKQKFSRHMRIHTGEKPFGCPICSYRTNQKSNVKVHMKVHGLGKMKEAS